MSPKAHFVSLNRKLNYFGRYRQGAQLAVYVQSDAFIQSMMAISPAQRRSVLALYAKIHERCAPPPGRPVVAVGGKVRWDEAAIARFRQEHARGGLERVREIFGLSAGGARMAAWRFVRHSTEHPQKAA
jgi:hypothetical protein